MSEQTDPMEWDEELTGVLEEWVISSLDLSWKKQPGDCLSFLGLHGSDGRGIIRIGDKEYRATHIKWWIEKGEPVPKGMYLIPRDTCCPDCGNLDHLDPISASDFRRRNNYLIRWEPEEARLEASIRREPSSNPDFPLDHLIWTGTYLLFRPKGGKQVSARRWKYEMDNKVALPSNKVLRCMCGLENCVESTHMKPMLRSEHGSRNRAEQMERNHAAKG